MAYSHSTCPENFAPPQGFSFSSRTKVPGSDFHFFVGRGLRGSLGSSGNRNFLAAFADSKTPAPPKPRPLPISAMPDARSLAASRSADASRALTSALRLVGRAMTSARAMAIAWLCWSKTVRNVVSAPPPRVRGGCLTTRPRGLGGLVVRGLGGLPDNPSHWKMMMKM